MNKSRIPSIFAMAVSIIVLGGAAAIAQDKYALQIPNGLAFSEFRGYETWQVVSLSHSDDTLNVIVANPVMIAAYEAGIPSNGQPWPDGAKTAKIQYIPKKSTEAPFNVVVPDTLKDVAFMAKDSKKYPDSGGWGYALFDYNIASRSFAPNRYWIQLRGGVPHGREDEGLRLHSIRVTLNSTDLRQS